MDTYVKGFSYMPAADLCVNDKLNYIKSGELEQTWKMALRQRIKQRDQKIWDEFVKEQDVVKVIYKDDPYQFLDQLPDSCLRELLETEFQKTKLESEQETPETIEKEESEEEVVEENMSNIILEESAEEGSNVNMAVLPEDVKLSAGSSRCTVKELPESPSDHPPSAKSKSSENLTSMIESSIYLAKVKELRSRTCEELQSIASYLEQKIFINVENREAAKLSKRCTEFSARFSRVHVYQLQRQLHDVRRHLSTPGPRHTLVRALLPRLMSLHQAQLQATQVLGRFVSVSGWWGDPAVVDSMVTLVRGAADPNLYIYTKIKFDDTQDITAVCDSLSVAVSQYTAHVADHFNSENALQRKKKKNGKNKIKLLAIDSRLSMYSQESSRKARALYRAALGVTSKSRVSSTAPADADHKPTKEVTKTKRESPRLRRKIPSELHTLVEGVAPSTPSVLSPPLSPRMASKRKPLVPPLRLLPNPKPPKSTSPKSKYYNMSKQETPRIKTNQVKETTGSTVRLAGRESLRQYIVGDDSKSVPQLSPRPKADDVTPEDVNKLLRELCSGDGLSTRKSSSESAKNIQLVCVKNCDSQPSTPQLLRILEETIQKKSPRQTAPPDAMDAERHRMILAISDEVSEKLFQYRTKFVQHMLTSPLYANSDVGKPWEMIGSISEHIIRELLLTCVKEMEIRHVTEELYKSELSS